MKSSRFGGEYVGLAREQVPLGHGAGQRAAGVVVRVDGEVRRAADHERPVVGVGGDLELGTPELFDVDLVRGLSGLRTVGDELHRCFAEVRRLRQRELEIEPAQSADRSRSRSRA